MVRYPSDRLDAVRYRMLVACALYIVYGLLSIILRWVELYRMLVVCVCVPWAPTKKKGSKYGQLGNLDSKFNAGATHSWKLMLGWGWGQKCNLYVCCQIKHNKIDRPCALTHTYKHTYTHTRVRFWSSLCLWNCVCNRVPADAGCRLAEAARKAKQFPTHYFLWELAV